jgi:hypothetical protein
VVVVVVVVVVVAVVWWWWRKPNISTTTTTKKPGRWARYGSMNGENIQTFFLNETVPWTEPA